MKRRITILTIVVTLAVLFLGCGQEFIDLSPPNALLVSLKVGDLVLQGNNIPGPVNDSDWYDEDFDLYGVDFKTIAFRQDTDIIDARFMPTVSRGAKVKYGIANRTSQPTDFLDTRVPATFDARDFIYFQITSSDDKITNYYRFATYMSSPVKELASIKIGGVEGDMGSVAPDETWNGDLITVGSLHITQNDAPAAEIDAELWDVRAALRYAVTPNRAAVPAFGTNSVLPFSDGQFLYVEVTAENADKNIYCFRVYVGRIATVKTLTFINPTRGDQEDKGVYEALGKGTAKNNWTDHTGQGSFDSPHQPNDGFTFSVELDEPNGTWQWAKVSSLTGTQPTWNTVSGNAATPKVQFGHEEYLVIKVIPPNRAAGANLADYFYKVKVGLLAAEFLVQPKSAWYLKDAPAAALTFTVDRGSVNDFTYQWYEINSWYGGYGFDSEGLIGEKGPLVAEPGWGEKDKGILSADGSTITYYGRSATLPAAGAGEIRFDVSDWYQKGLDEKDNVSLHNGGNQYYNLPIPGRPIPGAQSNTYTPPTDSTRRPFITNFSNESHYYWVVVTDKTTGLKATSARAVVITEWGVQYHNGQPTTVTVDKDHYLIDLYAYQTPGAFGLQEPPRNVAPFKDGNHRDEYYIPVTFPPGFDIYDYSVFTAQALFYLADGREWIQNWTQGDIGFARDERDEDGNKTNSGKIEEIVLWYNITNDNATRGLASSGNEPQGGGLIETPEYIIVKPAGTKPINTMPPFTTTLDSVGRYKPQNNNNAQGWFTPYIELCEVRFEGPGRAKPSP